jgi:hypothetical protein
MAEELRHAAGQATYEIREIRDGDLRVEAGTLFRCNDYGRAVEFAFDYLARRDPSRTGVVGGLQVVKEEGGRLETVWAYSHVAEESKPDPVQRWGFDVTRRWTAPTGPLPRPTSLARVPRRV